MQETGFLHAVYFTPKPGGTLEDAQKIIDGANRWLPGIPGARWMKVGVPGAKTRPVVDTDYTVALIVEFDDADAQDAYQVHPDHVKFVEECSKYWSAVRVFDTILLGD